MSFDLFHPIVRDWFTSTLGQPTAAQARGWDSIHGGQHTLIAAPTGSGKTLAAFLSALDELTREGLESPLPDEVRVVYVSPLKALSADIHKNLAEPREAIERLAAERGLAAPRITAAVRTGDTSSSERAAMIRTPPHILVTTPESLYLLLTSDRSRRMLHTVRTVIVDEIHAVIGTRRGAHLALTLERLQRVADRRLLRIGLSATQKPIDEVGRYLVGRCGDRCTIVDSGHRRAMDLAVEIPRSPLDAVMAHEVWEEYYDKLARLIQGHRTTLVFVNTRRLAERLAKHLSDRLGEDAVTAHHGSLSKERRLDAETRLKTGGLRALVATASLELGIDVGHVDLVCQIGSPRRIATFLQRVGRSGHTISGTPKGRLFPVSRDDLIECAALMRSVKQGELDAIVTHDAPLDVLAQQIVAESACQEYHEHELFDLVRRAWPYRDLPRRDFDAVVSMTAEGYSTRRGRRAALVHRDEINSRVRGRRGARLLAQTSGGAIPEIADYRVVLDPEETFIGTLNEDFAIESNAGDIFQLGNASWRILQVLGGTVRVADAKGTPPTIPFWLGEAPSRSDELSQSVSRLRIEVDELVDSSEVRPEALVEQFVTSTGLDSAAAEQALAYLLDGRRSLGVIPSQDTLILERFFDESGGMQLVLHAPFGSRVNKAWGLALRKRFCRQFNFELQAAATDDALMLSLGPQHSFPLSDVFRYLHPETTRDVLVQAFLDAPVFETRWRWNATLSLAVPRSRGGRKVAPQVQRMVAADLLASVFPDAAACLENIPGDREIPDHPLVNQTVRDCLEEAMDFEGLQAVLRRIHKGDIRLVARDTPEPSVFAHEILNARPYAFLDDAPLEERRSHAVQTRRGLDAGSDDLAALDQAAIAQVREEERPDPRDADELHDALMVAGFLRVDDMEAQAASLFASLASQARAGVVRLPSGEVRLPSGEVRLPSGEVRLKPDTTAGEARPKPDTTPREVRLKPDTTPREVRLKPDTTAGEVRPKPDTTAGEVRPKPDTTPGEVRLKPDTTHSEARSVRLQPDLDVWIAAERVPQLRAVHPEAILDPIVEPPASRQRDWDRSAAITELLRGRLTITGPTTAADLAASLAINVKDADAALLALESEGVILRGRFTPGHDGLEWCDRSLLARIHRYTLNRLRAEIEPVSPADFMRFLFKWQHVDPADQLTGLDGLREAIAMLDGFELAGGAWERAVLPMRVQRYESSLLDMLCLAGEVAWGRLSQAPSPTREAALEPVRLTPATPIALFLREHADAWQTLRSSARDPQMRLTENARRILELLRAKGASFFNDLRAASGLDAEDTRLALGTLVAARLAASDGFSGLRALMRSGPSRPAVNGRQANFAGRWVAIGEADTEKEGESTSTGAGQAAVERQAWALLRRYGIVFRRLLTRESIAAPWRELARVYRRLEARGEIRGGRFVSGMSGEQFALPLAVERLREVRRTPADGRLFTISAADPLNLAGIITSGDRLRAAGRNRILYRDGVPVAVLEGDFVRELAPIDPSIAEEVSRALSRRRVPVLH